jgi:hypothetical protein
MGCAAQTISMSVDLAPGGVESGGRGHAVCFSVLTRSHPFAKKHIPDVV